MTATAPPTTAVKPGDTRDFRNDIQGLRAIAVAAVVLYHASLPIMPGGYIGVDVFFVISGFLITSHLLKSATSGSGIRFANFYARRARRILPASFVVVFVSIIAALIWYPPLLMREVWKGAVATALYVPNYLFAKQGTDYLSESTPSLFQHFWSLGVEEQFYLIWPALLGIGFLFVKSRRGLFMVVSLIVVVSFAICVALTYRSQPWAFFSLPTRAWELGVGGLGAFLLAYRPRVLHGSTAAAVGWFGVAGIIGSAFLFTDQTPFPSYWAAVPVFSTALVIIAGATSPRFGPGRALSVRGLIFIGTISYSLYLVHWPMQLIPQVVAGYDNPLPVGVKVGIGLAGVPVAWLMYRFVENPVRVAPILNNARPRRTLLAAGVASMALVIFATGAYLYSNTLPLHTDDVVAATVIEDPPLGTDVVAANLAPSLRSAEGDTPIIYDDGCHRDFSSTNSDGCVFGDESAPRIALFGDSHAAQWFPALQAYAEAKGYAVETFTKSSCPSVDIDIEKDGVPYTECMTWRAGVIENLNDTPPALVVIANFGGVAPVDYSESNPDNWEQGLEATLEALDAPKVVLVDTPIFLTSPAICLSKHLTEAQTCGASTTVALNSDSRHAEVAATTAQDVALVDMTPYLCTSTWCPSIIGNTLVYRDQHHITATFSSELSEAFGDRLAEVLNRSEQG